MVILAQKILRISGCDRYTEQHETHPNLLHSVTAGFPATDIRNDASMGE